MAVDFSIAGSEVNDATSLLVVEGDLDLFTAPELRSRINDAIDEGHPHLVIDLSNATAVDSTTLGVLIGAVKRLRLRGGDLVVVCDSPTILRMLEITGLDEVLVVVDSRHDALEAVGSGR